MTEFSLTNIDAVDDTTHGMIIESEMQMYGTHTEALRCVFCGLEAARGDEAVFETIECNASPVAGPGSKLERKSKRSRPKL